jgi:chromosome segregation ATPase
MSTPRNSNTPRVSTQDITEVAALASQRRRTPTEAGAVKVPHTVFVDLEPKMAAMASKLSPSQSRARKILEDSARRLATSKSPRTPRRSIASPKTKAEDDAIMELSLSIKHREAEVNSIRRKIQKQQQLAEETNGSNDAYTLLLVQYMEREEELRVALNEKKALGENVSTLKKQVIELKKFGNKNATDVEKMDKMEEEWRAMAKKVTTLQMEITLQNRAIATFEDMIKNKNAEIERVTREKEDVINERTQLEDIVKTLSKVKEEADITEAKAGAATAALESNAILISMQKERLQEQSMLIKTYEKRFLTKGMDLPKSKSSLLLYDCSL